MRWKLTIEYDGSPFQGWQVQNDALTVQEAIQQALFGLTQESVTLCCAGRTDSGVHAYGQVAHGDIDKPLTAKKMRDGLNAHLKPHPAAVVEAEPVHDDFHARFDAVQRRYLYRILNRSAPSPLLAKRALHCPRPLDIEAMRHACRLLCGQHDFTSFRSAHCQANSPVKTIDEFTLAAPDTAMLKGELHIEVAARSFLYHQVRNMVGTLLKIGSGVWPPESAADILQARDRARAGPTAPAHGLYLTAVRYG